MSKYAPDTEIKATQKKLFLVGRTLEDGHYEFQGIFDSKELASDSCRDETYFVSEELLNVLLPHETIEWGAICYPKAKI